MLRAVLGVITSLFVIAGSAGAFEVEATIKKVDADKGLLVFNAQNQDRTAKTEKDVKVQDATGKDLPGGLANKDLKEGTVVRLSIERVDNKPVIRSIQLVKKGEKSAKPAAPSQDKLQADTSKLRPLIDLGNDEYQGFKGGLYPDGKNVRPAQHEKGGLALAKTIQPLDANGKPSPEGKIVLLGIGFSNTVQAFNGFMKAVEADHDINPKLLLVNGAVGGMSASMVQNPDDNGTGTKYWGIVDERLKAAGVTRAQVQVVWIKETDPRPPGGFPKYTQDLQAEITKIVQSLPRRFPQTKLAYFSSRTYAGWAKGADGRGPGNTEPYSYETGFAVKWLIEQQIKGYPTLNYDAHKGPITSPWLSWSAYLWANGPVKRSDGFSFELEDFMERDRMHESPAGQAKVGKLLLDFFKNDTTTRGWFLKPV